MFYLAEPMLVKPQFSELSHQKKHLTSFTKAFYKFEF
jgi:hypothetical protein